MSHQPALSWKHYALSAVFVAWLFDYLFWGKLPGISFPIFTFVAVSAGLVLAWKDGLRLSRTSLVLIVPILFFAVMVASRQEPLTVFLSAAFTLLLMTLMALSLQGGKWPVYNLADYVVGYVHLMVSGLSKLAETYVREKKEAPASEPGARKAWLPAVRGTLLALPIVTILAALLAAADPIFSDRLEWFLQIFRIENITEYIIRGVFILVLGYIFAGIYLHATRSSSDERILGIHDAWLKPFLGWTEAAIILGSVVALFVFFVALQFQYFFGGQANISSSGYTYAEYARRGFSELVAVAFISLVLFLGLSSATRRVNSSQQRSFSALGVALVSLVIVILVSAFQRLALYESAYGFTRLRTYTHVFMIWLGILLVVVLGLELFKHQRRFALALVLAGVGFAASLSLLNVDAFIARQNITRAADLASSNEQDQTDDARNAELDVATLASLSDDAVPILAQAFKNSALDGETREAVGAALACNQYWSQGDGYRTSRYWQSFHLSTYRATAVFSAIEPELDRYEKTEAWSAGPGVRIENSTYPCYSDSMD